MASAIRLQVFRSAATASAIRLQVFRSAATASAIRFQVFRSAATASAIRSQVFRSAATASAIRFQEGGELFESPKKAGIIMRRYYPHKGVTGASDSYPAQHVISKVGVLKICVQRFQPNLVLINTPSVFIGSGSLWAGSRSLILRATVISELNHFLSWCEHMPPDTLPGAPDLK
ncbi:hypothetical protein C8R44DRAFT_745472 [Mycena epipterygia]|nr:hypothetical protein C8R44DRAFT_745472 [Mycena epipterygia]